MKNIIFAFLILLIWGSFSTDVQAQTSEVRNAVSYKFAITDYNSLDTLYKRDRGDDPRFMHPDDMNYALEISYSRFINKSLNLSLPMRVGSVDSYHFNEENNSHQRIRSEFFIGGDLIATYKFNNDYILKEDFVLAPYLGLGFGGKYLSQRTEKYDLQLPMIVGLNIKLDDNFYMQVQGELRKSFIAKKDNIVLSAGVNWLIGKRKVNEEE